MYVDEWTFPQKKSVPMSLTYSPELLDNSEEFMNPFLGYPNCPLIGRYNKGEYKIGETVLHLQFKCKYDHKNGVYKCGQKAIKIPEKMLHNLRNIPEMIATNKQQNIKNAPQYHPERYEVTDYMNFIWIVSFGEMGKDFLNYLNHMYTLACTLFLNEKLQRSVYYLPVYVYLPEKSGLMNEEVQRGISINNYRSQYLSFHLKSGAPAFSPNNMRLGVEGMKKIVSKKNNPPPQNDKKFKRKYIEKNASKQQEQKVQIPKNQEVDDTELNWQQMQKQIKQEAWSKQQKQQERVKKQPEQKETQSKNNAHKGYIQFYSSVLLQKDYRVYYHWHIEDQFREEIIKELLANTHSVNEFIEKYQSLVTNDELSEEIIRNLY